jgi:hypothetical protein
MEWLSQEDHRSQPLGLASEDCTAAPGCAHGISAKELTYLFLIELSNSGELGGDTSSGYEIDWVAYEFRGNRVVIGLGDGCE